MDKNLLVISSCDNSLHLLSGYISPSAVDYPASLLTLLMWLQQTGNAIVFHGFGTL